MPMIARKILAVFAFAVTSVHAFAGWTSLAYTPPPTSTVGTQIVVGAGGACNEGPTPTFLVCWWLSPTGVWSHAIMQSGTTGSALSGTMGITLDAVGTWKIEVTNIGASVSVSTNSLPVGTMIAGPNYPVVAPGTVSTTVTVGSVTAPTFSTNTQNLSVSATVSGSPTAGTVTFTLKNSAGTVLATAPATVSTGTVNGTIVIPANTAAGSGYTITAAYAGATSGSYTWTSSNGTGSAFSINPPVTVSTTTTLAAVGDQTFSASATGFSVSATVNAPIPAMITFTLREGSSGNAIATSTAMMSGGTASGGIAIPAGSAVGTYTVTGTYPNTLSGNYNYSTSTGGQIFAIKSATVSTTTDVDTVTAPTFSTSAQNLVVSATVRGSSTPTGGTMKFTLKNSLGVSLATVTGTVLTGNANGIIAIPAGTPAGSGYTIVATYTPPASGNYSYTESSDTTGESFRINPSAVATTTTVGSATALTFSTSAQNLSVSATVRGSPTPTTGTVRFTLKNSSGAALATTTGTVLAESTESTASGTIAIPAGTPAGSGYTVSATYEGATSGNYTWSASSGTGSAFSVSPLSVTTTTVVGAVTAPTFSTSAQNLSVSATVSGSLTPTTGTVKFTLKNPSGIALATTTGTAVAAGKASDTITIPAGMPAGSGYTVSATYEGATSGNYTWTSSSGTGSAFSVSPLSVTTTTAVDPVTAPTFSTGTQNLSVSATVSGSLTPTTGTVTFTLKNSSGTDLATTRGTVLAASTESTASGTIAIPAGTPAGSGYTVSATYEGATSGNYTWTSSNGTGSAFSINKRNQTITLTPPDTNSSRPITLTAVATSGLPVAFSVSPSSTATVSGRVLTILGTGTITVTASQPGDANNNPASSVSCNVTLCNISQTITFDDPGPRVKGYSFDLGATATSGLTVTYAVSGPASLSNGSTLTITGTGTVTVTASQSGNTQYAAAADVVRAFTAATTGWVERPASSVLLSNTAYPLTCVVNANSVTIPILYLQNPAGVWTICGLGNYGSSGLVTLTPPPITINTRGTWKLRAAYHDASNPGMLGDTVEPPLAAMSDIADFPINVRGTQTITFPDPSAGGASHAMNAQPFELLATSDSGLPVTYRVSGPATLSSTVIGVVTHWFLAVTGTAPITVTASQSGDCGNLPAVEVSRTFNGAPPPGPMVTVDNLTLSNGTLTGSGWALDYRDGAPVTVKLIVNGQQQSATMTTAQARADVQTASVTNGWSTKNVTNSGWSFGFDTASLGAKPYNVIVTATNTQNSTTSSATYSFASDGISRTINFGTLADKAIGDPSFVLNASSVPSGLPITYEVVSGPATVFGNLVILGDTPGVVTIRATVTGDGTHASASTEQSFTLNDNDADNDGLPDWWETHWGGVSGGAQGDPDNDGIVNIDEYNLRQCPNYKDVAGLDVKIPIDFFIVQKGTGSGTVTLVIDGKTYTQSVSDNYPVGVEDGVISLPLGGSYPIQVSSTGSIDFAIKVKVWPQVSPLLQIEPVFDKKYTGVIEKTEIVSGTTTLRLAPSGEVAFAAIDTSMLETMRTITFGLGDSRSGASPGRIVFYSGPFHGLNGIQGNGKKWTFIEGPAMLQTWQTSTHFQAKVPAGYVDVVQTRSRTTVKYFAPASGSDYPESGGFKDFSAATLVATYLVDHVDYPMPDGPRPDSDASSLGLPFSGAAEFLGADIVKVTRYIGTIPYVLEYSTSKYDHPLVKTEVGYDPSSPNVHVSIGGTEYGAIVRLLPWRRDGVAPTGLSRLGYFSTYRFTEYNTKPYYAWDNTLLEIKRYDGATESSPLAAYEKKYYAGDGWLMNVVSAVTGLGTDQQTAPYTWYRGYDFDASGTLRGVNERITFNGIGGLDTGVTIKTLLTPGSSYGSVSNMDGQPFIAEGEIKSIRQSFGDDPIWSATDLVTTYSYGTALVDWKPRPSSMVTMQGSTQIGGMTYTYNTGLFNNDSTLPFVTTTTIAKSSSSAALNQKQVKMFSDRLSDLDRKGKPVSITNPDNTKLSYAYQSGTLGSDGSWTPGSNGTDLLIAELSGCSGSTVTTYRGAPVDPLDMEANHSTVTERVFNSAGWLKRTATLVFDGSVTPVQLAATLYDYDIYGNLKIKTDQSGRVLYQADFTSFRKNWSEDEQGVRLTYTYDSYDRVKTMVRSAASFDVNNTVSATTTTYSYDAIGRLLTESVSAAGTTEALVTSYIYDTGSRIKARTQPGNFPTLISYDSPTQTTTTLPGGGTRIETTYFDGRPKATSGTAVPDVASAYSYDASGNLNTVLTSTIGQTTTTVADWLGRTVSVTTPTWVGSTRTTSYIYNGLGQLTEQQTKSGGIKVALSHLFTYDGYGRLESEALDADGNDLLSTTADYDVKKYEFSYGSGPSGALAGKYRYDGVVVWPYDGTNASTSHYTSKTYTQLTGLTATTVAHTVAFDFDGNQVDTTTSVDRAGKLVTTSTTASGTDQTILQISLNGLPIKSTNAQGQTTLMTYEPLGRLETSDDPRIGLTSVIYFPGTTLVESVTTPDNKTTSNTYDTAGRISSKTNNNQKTDYFQYDDAGNLTYQWGNTVNPVRYEYNDLGQKTKMHTYRSGTWTGPALPGGFGGEGDVTTWDYQPATGLLNFKQDAAYGTTRYHYDAMNRPSQRTDARSWVTNYTYTAAGLPWVTSYTDGITPTVTYAYDRASRVKTVDDVSGRRTFAYYDTGSSDTDLLNRSARLKSETLPAYFGSHVLNYSYQYSVAGRVNGALSSFQLDGGSLYSVGYSYDAITRPQTISYNALTPFTYTYVDNSNLVDTVAQSTTGYKRDYDYEPDSNRLSTLKNSWAGVTASTVETRLTYEPLTGLRMTEKTAGTGYMAALGRSAEFGVYQENTYTDRAELDNSAKHLLTSTWDLGSLKAGTDRDYTYDPIGNRTADVVAGVAGAYAPNALNQYLNAPGVSSYIYDANGNLTNDGTRVYAYDGENRLITVTQGSSVWHYEYDYQGRRIRKYGTGLTETRFIYDGWNLIAETDAAGTLTRRFAWGLDVSGSLQGAGGVGGLLAIQTSANTTYYPLYDPSHNVIGLYDSSGTFAAAYEYDPFGGTQTKVGSYSTANPFRSATKYTDNETNETNQSGLVYYGLRYYSPKLGRFINRDPIEEAGGINLYAFCGNDGVNRFDLLGMTTQGYPATGDDIKPPPPSTPPPGNDNPFDRMRQGLPPTPGLDDKGKVMPDNASPWITTLYESESYANNHQQSTQPTSAVGPNSTLRDKVMSGTMLASNSDGMYSDGSIPYLSTGGEAAAAGKGRASTASATYVYYWAPEGGFGHLSMRLYNDQYISNWPADNMKHPFGGGTTRPPSFVQDTHDEGRVPQVAVIFGLDTNKMAAWWNARESVNGYTGLGQNCSWTVAEGLHIGGLALDRALVERPGTTWGNIQNAISPKDPSLSFPRNLPPLGP